MNPIDPAALDCLVALADTGSFERAAQQLSVTQSAVSQRLRSLESDLGRLLVVRSRPLRLTDAGKLLLRHARRWQALRGCSVAPLGCMRYLAVASPQFIATHLPQGLNRRNFSALPWLVFNRKDDMAAA